MKGTDSFSEFSCRERVSSLSHQIRVQNETGNRDSRILTLQLRKTVLAHRNSRTPDPCLAVDGNLYTRRMSSDFRAEALANETNDEPKKEEEQKKK